MWVHSSGGCSSMRERLVRRVSGSAPTSCASPTFGSWASSPKRSAEPCICRAMAASNSICPCPRGRERHHDSYELSLFHHSAGRARPPLEGQASVHRATQEARRRGTTRKALATRTRRADEGDRGGGECFRRPRWSAATRERTC